MERLGGGEIVYVECEIRSGIKFTGRLVNSRPNRGGNVFYVVLSDKDYDRVSAEISELCVSGLYLTITESYLHSIFFPNNQDQHDRDDIAYVGTHKFIYVGRRAITRRLSPMECLVIELDEGD